MPHRIPRSTLQKLFDSSPGRRQPIVTRARRTSKPFLELLEDRRLLSAYSVTNTNYSGTGSLGAEIAAAVAANDSAAVITFSGVAADSTIQLSSSDVNSAAAGVGPTAFLINSDDTSITIDGSGAPGLVIDGGSAVRLFAVAFGSALTLGNLTVADGSSLGKNGAKGGTGYRRGRIRFRRWHLHGSWIVPSPTTTPRGGTGTGGSSSASSGSNALGSRPVPSMSSSAGLPTSALNGGEGIGGGIFSIDGALTLDNDTFTANSAIGGTSRAHSDGQGLGGAIFAESGSLALLNDTISGNTAAQGGRGVYLRGGGASAILGGGYIATATINNTIIGQSDTSVSDFVALTKTVFNDGPALTSGVGNLIRTQTGFSGTIVSTANPMLAALANNGGPTETMALNTGSPAIDAGNSAAVSGLTTDQRGPDYPRIDNGTVDIGAFEVQTRSTSISTTTALTTSASPSTYGDAVTFTATVTSTSTPTGSVNFVIDGGTAVAGIAGSTTGTTANWTYSTSALSAGSNTVEADYVGTGTFSNSFGTLSGGQTVNEADATIAVTTSATPTTYGDSVTFTATVTSTSTPTGNVNFVIDGGTAVAGTAGSTTGTTATSTYTTSTLTAGTHTVEDLYFGGGNFTNSIGTLSGGQTVNEADATIAVTTSATPTTYRDSVTFTATVTSTSTPTGSVNFVIDGGTAVAGIAGSTTGTTATWTYTTSTLTTGTHTVEALYVGGGNFTNSTATLSDGQTVNPSTKFTVTNTNYSGTGSLGAEIAAAVAANASAAVITFSGVAADSTIQLSSSDVNSAAAGVGPTAFLINSDDTSITIDGSGAPGLVIDGGSAVRLFAVAFGSALTLGNLTVADGSSLGKNGAKGGTGAGGGVYVSDGGTFTALDCTFTNNNAQGGTGTGGSSSASSGSNALGSRPVPSMSSSAGLPTSALNGGEGIGGGIFSIDGALTLDNDTFTANSAIGGTSRAHSDGQGLGGAIFAESGSLALLNDTISGNTAAQGGRGVYLRGGGASAILGGGYIATATINNTIIGQSDTSVSDFVALTKTVFNDGPALTSGVGNLIGTQTGFSGTIVSTANPLLAALADNGGPTETMALESASPAINTGNTAAASGLTTDQRGPGYARIVNGTVDIGAFEVQTASTSISTTTALATSASPSTYGDSVTFTATVTSTSTATGSVNFVIDGGTAVAGTAGSTTGTTATWTYSTKALSAGSHTVLADYVRTGTFSDSTGTLSGGQTVNTAALTVTATNESMTYGGTLPALTYTYTGLVNGDSTAAFSGGLTTTAASSTSVGVYPITQGTLAATGNYTIGTFNAGTLTVNTASLTLTITADNDSKTYGTLETFSATAFTENGLVNSDTITSVTETTTGAPMSAAVGTYPIVPSAATGSGLSNYTIGYVDGTLTVNAAPLTVTATNESMTYGGTVPALTYTYVGLVNNDTSAAFSGGLTTTATSSTSVGGYPITQGTLAATGNYTIGTVNAGTLTVNTASLTLTAANEAMTYGGTVPALTYTYTGLVNGDSTATFSGGLTTTAMSSTSVGGYPITQGTLAATGNYAIGTFNDGTLTVNATPLTVTAANKSMTYGGTVPALTYTYTGLVNGDSTAAFSGGLTTTAMSSTSVGGYPITQGTLAATGNYTISTFNAGTLMVNAAKLIVTATNESMTYGGTVPALAYTYTGLVNGDSTATFSGGLTTTAMSSTSVGGYPITQGTLAATGNYTIATFNGGTLTINKAATGTIVASSANPSVYGQAATFTATVTNTSIGSTPVPTGTVQFVVDGGNFGAPVAVDATGRAVSQPDAFLSGASHTVQAVYTNIDGNFIGSNSTTLTQTVQTVAVEPDPSNPALTDLFIGSNGATSNDQILVNPVGNSNTGSTGVKVQTKLGGVNTQTTYSQALSTIYVFLQGGNDSVQLANTLTMSAVVTAGNGNDQVQLGNGSNDSVTLGNGNDHIQIANGNNPDNHEMVSLGAGNDQVQIGDGSNDTVIAGAGNDQVQIGSNNNTGLDSSETIALGTPTGTGNDNVQLGDGSGDSVTLQGTGNDQVQIGSNNTGRDYSETVTLGNGNDTVQIGDGNGLSTGADHVRLGNVNDNVQIGGGNNANLDSYETVILGTGNDQVQIGNGTQNTVTTTNAHDKVKFASGPIGTNGNSFTG